MVKKSTWLWISVAIGVLMLTTSLMLPAHRRLQPRDQEARLHQLAWNEFALLTSRTVRSTDPEWERVWKTKQDVGLKQQVHHAKVFAEVAKIEGQFDKLRDENSEHRLELLNGSLRLAVQSLHPGTDVLSHPQFAAVLFNETAARSMKRAEKVLDDATSRKDINFEPGSMIAKAVWTVLPLEGSTTPVNQDAYRFFATNIANSKQEDWEAGQQPPDQFKPIPPGPNDPNRTPFILDASLSTSSGCRPGGSLPHLPLRCLHATVYNLQTDPNAQSKPAEAGNNDPIQVAFRAVHHNCEKGESLCVVALVGIHIMMRVDDKDSQGGRYPWVFMTFWWTGVDNGQRVNGQPMPEPWRYYQMNVTQTPRIDQPTDGFHNVCYNPYLESVERNGTQTNCVTCHTYAAYTKAAPHTSPAQTGAMLGSTMVTETPSMTLKEYLSSGGLKSTDFVWSLAGYQGKPLADTINKSN